MSRPVCRASFAPLPFFLILVSCSGCHAPRPIGTTVSEPWKGEVPLEAMGGFDAYLVHAGDVGIWTVKCLPIFERYGCPQIVALDDRGRCTILNSYSGKWTPTVAVQDGQWLGGIAHADVDPRRLGKELYVGGKRGNIYQVWPHPQGGFDANVVGYLPGKEIHTLVAGDLDRSRPGLELIAFTRPGGLYAIEPSGDAGTSFTCRLLQELPGRIRDAVILDADEGASPVVATVSRAGEVALLRFETGKPTWTVIYRTEMGLGRIAVKPSGPRDSPVLYVTADDGRILRLQREQDGSFSPEVVFAGPQGPRGLVAGRFDEDPNTETLAVFGYSRKVQLLTREADGWRVETIFEDLDKGHWLAAAELDGRNATDELIASGYGSRVILLARPPGFGLGSAGGG